VYRPGIVLAAHQRTRQSGTGLMQADARGFKFNGEERRQVATMDGSAPAPRRQLSGRRLPGADRDR
jgi:hypothetical protein